MASKTSGLRGLNLSPLGQSVSRKLTQFVIVGGCLLLLSGCAMRFPQNGWILHKPSCDISPVLKLQLPEQIDTLAGVPRTEIIVENGINKKVGGRQPDEIKEMFYFREGTSEYKFDGKVYLLKDTTEYKFIVFYSEAAAIKWYGTDSNRNVFHETTANGLMGRVHYTEESRAESGGGMGDYTSRADFRLHNLYIRVTTEDRKTPHNDKLSNAVKHLAQMLGAALSANQ
jgi:hypothetical protein